MSDRMKAHAENTRRAAETVRERGNEAKAKQMEARADELESGRVTDVTEPVSRLISWGLGRR